MLWVFFSWYGSNMGSKKSEVLLGGQYLEHYLCCKESPNLTQQERSTACKFLTQGKMGFFYGEPGTFECIPMGAGPHFLFGESNVIEVYLKCTCERLGRQFPLLHLFLK